MRNLVIRYENNDIYVNDKKINKKEFITYYLCHSRKETIIKFDISIGAFFRIQKQFNVHKTKEQIHNEESMIKTKKTKLEKYGNENYNNREKSSKTCLEKYGVENSLSSFQIREKIVSTNLKKYGVENVFQNKNIINKLKNTKLIKYGDENFTNREKARKTCLDKYGTEQHLSNDEIRQKIKNTTMDRYGVNYFSETSMWKIKFEDTMMQRYGVNNYVFTDEYKKLMKDKIDDIVEKRVGTMRKNKTFNVSKDEIYCYKKLCDIFGNDDVISQYRDERYKFNCDFYIKSLDMFIELNFHWTHGLHRYDSNSIEDINKVEYWKTKEKKQYKNAIYVWTDLDVRKYNLASRYNLKYVVLYNKKELNEFLDSLEEKENE